MITIVDLQIGNIGSVSRALKFLKSPFEITSDAEKILAAKKLMLPGVGSFAAGSKNIDESGLRPVLREAVLNKKTPILGVCVGMQLFAEFGYEGGESLGLGFLNATVQLLPVKNQGIRLPHMGWNHLESADDLKLLSGTPKGGCFYFVHSYAMTLNEPVKCATANHGSNFVAMIEKNNIFATQFHPEKSQANGLKILQNFIEI